MGKTHKLPTAAMLFILMAMTAGCKKSVSDPEISLVPGEATATSIEFKASTANAATAAYLVVESEEKIPDASTIFEQGTRISAGENVSETVSGLIPATEYTVAAVAASEDGVLSATATITVSTVSDLYADITSEHSDLWWYGAKSCNNSEQFCLQMSTAEVDESLMPVEGGELVRIYMFAAPLADKNEIFLAPGKYTIGKAGESTPMTFNPDGSIYAKGTNAEDWSQGTFESGEITVEYDGSQYSITANLVLADGKQSKVRARHTGTMRVTDYSYGFRLFTDDKDETMVGMTGYVSSSSAAPDLDAYEILIYNCELDKDGFIIGRGYVFGCSIYTKAAPTYAEYDFSGTYTPNPDWEDNIYLANTFIPGFPYDFGMIVPAGTYLAEYSDAGQIISAGFVKEGKIVMSRADGKCKIEGSLVTDNGVNIKVSYDGPDVPLADYKTNPTSQGPVFPGLPLNPDRF